MWGQITTLLKDKWERVRYAWAFLKAAWRFYIVARFLHNTDFAVYKALAINEDTSECAKVTAVFDRENWENSVRIATGWTTPRIRADVRYMAHGRKYRLVLRPGDACAFAAVPERHRGGPKGVMAAMLRARGDLVGVDITRRVLKYQGPNKDFHSAMNLKVGVLDMFPYDDAEELKDYFHTLYVVDAQARTHIMPLVCRDIKGALTCTSSE